MLRIQHKLCTECGACVPICHADALRLDITGLEVDAGLCDLCNICVLICPTEALAITEREREEV